MLPRNFRMPGLVAQSLLLLALGQTLWVAASSPKQASLTVSAAISLKDALEEIKLAFEKDHPEIPVILNLGASGMLQRQIENGAPVDVFLSAAPKQMDVLEAKELVLPGTRREILRNTLVLIVPPDSSISGFPDLMRSSVTRVALGEASSVPAGQYAQEVLRYFKIFEDVKRKAVFAKDERQVLTYVETGNVDAGIVYGSDALARPRVKIAAEAPEISHSPIRYSAAVIRASRNLEAAREFLAYANSETAKKIFARRGFSPTVP